MRERAQQHTSRLAFLWEHGLGGSTYAQAMHHGLVDLPVFKAKVLKLPQARVEEKARSIQKDRPVVSTRDVAAVGQESCDLQLLLQLANLLLAWTACTAATRKVRRHKAELLGISAE